MVSAWTVYFVLKLDAIKDVLKFISFMSIAIFFASLWSFGDNANAWGIVKRSFCFALAMILLLIAVPSTKEMAAIIIIPKITNTEILNAAGDKTKVLIDLAEEKIKESVGK